LSKKNCFSQGLVRITYKYFYFEVEKLILLVYFYPPLPFGQNWSKHFESSLSHMFLYFVPSLSTFCTKLESTFSIFVISYVTSLWIFLKNFNGFGVVGLRSISSNFLEQIGWFRIKLKRKRRKTVFCK